MKFGFLKDATSIRWANDSGIIKPLEDHADIVSRLHQHECVHDGWFHPSVQALGHNDNAPRVPTSFALPATHTIALADPDASAQEAHFMIALFGMLKGQRLQRPDWQHLYKAPIAPKLNDFVASDSEISATMDIATTFWGEHDGRVQL